MNADQVNELRYAFQIAMKEWDVPVSVNILDDTAEVSFKLWWTHFKGSFYLVDEQWQPANCCQHYIVNSESVWQWIAMQLHDKLTA